MFELLGSYILANFHLLLNGVASSLGVIMLSLVITIPGSLVVAMAHCSDWKVLRGFMRCFLEFYRALPMPLLLLAGFFLLPQVTGMQVDGPVVAIGVFSLWGSLELGELVRGALVSLPKNQVESGKALGMSKWQLYCYILLPQAIPRMLPSAINLSTRMVKTSSYLILVGVVDVVKQTQQIIERTHEPLTGYLVLGFMFFAICYPLSCMAKYWEHRIERKEVLV